MSLPFLLEIGCEEIPDWMIPPALKSLRGLFEKLYPVTWTEGTPRRLVLRADSIGERQADAEELVMGPPKSAGPGAAAGFAKKMGVDAGALAFETTPKGEYLSFRRKVAGRETLAILAEALPGLIEKIYFPKTMYWTGKSGPRFIRPIRWIVALFDDRVVPFEIAGVTSGNITRGHRQLGGAAIEVTISDYQQKLRDNFVLLAADERRQKIETEIASFRTKADPGLLQKLVFMTEYPTAILGHFDRQYLSLPKEVLVTVMRHHQNYFSIEDSGGQLAPKFVAVMNTKDDAEGLVRKGHERVLRARFNDARFFWDVDQKKTLAARVDDLAHITFHAKLGSYLDKTNRLVALTKELTPSGHAHRAAQLSKCDLTTDMVKEFTDLQGIVGGLYAQAQGEPDEVWRAIYHHYKPLSMEDSIPPTADGRVVALADKLDTLRECFRAGIIPSGSKDPFALRRAAQGVIKILVEGNLDFPLSKLLNNDPPLTEFMLDRIRYYFKEIHGFKYDEVNAVLASARDNLPDVQRRLTALREVRPTENFEPLAASFKRIQNILTQAKFSGSGQVNPSLFEPGPERDLYDAVEATRTAIGNVEYRPALEAIAGLRPKVDLFFDKILVNAPDPLVRQNRLTLLNNLLTEFSTIADFSEIVTQ